MLLETTKKAKLAKAKQKFITKKIDNLNFKKMNLTFYFNLFT